jgi:endonuclease YncB( thermonuclease family)
MDDGEEREMLPAIAAGDYAEHPDDGQGGNGEPAASTFVPMTSTEEPSRRPPHEPRATIPWYRRPNFRSGLRLGFALLNAVVFFAALLVLIEFIREVEREEGDKNDPNFEDDNDDNGDGGSASGGAPQDATWQDRYVLLGTDVFGDNFQTVVDVYFAVVILATFAGFFGALLRAGRLIWVATVLYLPAWVFTFVIVIGVHHHIASGPETESGEAAADRYTYALAWAWMSIIVIAVMFAVAIFLARNMKDHKADRFRVQASLLESDYLPFRHEANDKESPGSAGSHVLVSQVPRWTTDGSGPPRLRQQAETAERRSAAAAKVAPPANPTDSFASASSRRDRQILTAQVVKDLLLRCTTEQLPAAAERKVCHHVYDGDTLTLATRERVRLAGIDTPEISRCEAFSEEARAFTKRWCHGRTVYLHQPTLSASYEEASTRATSNASKGNDQFLVDKHGRRRAVIYVGIRKDALVGGAAAAARDNGDATGSDGPTTSTPCVATASTCNAYLNVNEALLVFGYAFYYATQPLQAELPFQARFLNLQKDARDAGRGIWGGFVDRDVVWSPTSDVFHTHVAKGASGTVALGQCSEGQKLSGRVGGRGDVRKGLASKAMDAGLAPCRACTGSCARIDV